MPAATDQYEVRLERVRGLRLWGSFVLRMLSTWIFLDYGYGWPPTDVLITQRADGRVVYRLRGSAGRGLDEGVATIEQDLERLSVDDFREKYGIGISS